ncbi:T9SS type A sorting domain-containing protein [Calditrichota bacterium]
MKQNYPNPFNPRTNIKFSIPKTELVTLKIYNLLGQEVATLVSDKLVPGNYTYTWDASHFASGVYYYKIQAGGFVQTRKLILMK